MPSGASDGSARCTMALYEPLRSEPQIERTFKVGMTASPAWGMERCAPPRRGAPTPAKPESGHYAHLLSVRMHKHCPHAHSPDEERDGCYFSFSIGFESTPTPSISISQVSPCFIHIGFGLRAWPTPEGVPVKTTSPGSSVMPWVT